MKATLEKIGWLDEIIVNTVTGHVINGHMRVSIAMRDNEPTVPVRYVELSQEEENLALATFDTVSGMATTDKDVLEALLMETEPGGGILEQFLSTMLPAGSSLGEDAGDQEENLGDTKFMILVECEDEDEQVALLERFIDEGIACKALNT